MVEAILNSETSLSIILIIRENLLDELVDFFLLNRLPLQIINKEQELLKK